jgi:prepilin-type N-terminal cleavage/methylation domain-containing protein
MREEGFSFLEVLMTLVIFAIALLMIGSIFPLATKSLTGGKEMMQANYLAQEKLEELINVLDLTPADSGDEQVEHFTREWIVDDKSSDPTILEDLMRIRIRILWKDPYGQNKSIVLTTFVSKER